MTAAILYGLITGVRVFHVVYHNDHVMNREQVKGIERRMLDLLKFKLASGQSDNEKMRPITGFNVDPVASGDAEFFALLRNELWYNAVLIYCKADLLAKIRNSFPQAVLVECNTQPDFLRGLDDVDTECSHHLLVVTDASMMRILDFRAALKGISRYVFQSFTSGREALKGLGRVGRFGDSCKRFIMSEVGLVDMT
jgi:hypothetical protein